MEENNKKGPGIFYAVIGIATLLVAIIGATFAFFSAQASNKDTIQGNTAQAGGITLAVKPVTSTGDNIIPLNLIVNQTKKEGSDTEYVDSEDQFADAMTNKCVDINGNNVCQVYKITLTNNSATSAVQVRGSLNLTSNATNMYWKLIDATTETSGEEGSEVEKLATGTAPDYTTNVMQGTTGYLTVGGNSDTPTPGNKDVANLKLAGNASKNYYVVVWLEEVGTAQEGVDASNETTQRTFTGNVSFDAVDANGATSGVTATFTR